MEPMQVKVAIEPVVTDLSLKPENKDEKELLLGYRQLTAEDRERLLRLLTAMLGVSGPL
jgi:hypothetical protein